MATLPVAPPPSQAVWRVAPRDKSKEARLQQELGIGPLLAAALVSRGLELPLDAHRFLNPSFEQFHDPAKLPDFGPAVKAILAAREKGQTIYVHGDYDVDGVTSAALFTRFLGKIGCKIVPHVPHRMKEGYGIHLDAVEWARGQGADLFLTCDCGSSAIEQIKAVRAAGMKSVVTDHHEVGEVLPDSDAVVNPHRRDSVYPFPQISGVGVVLKLCAGITRELGEKVDNFYSAYLDLAVLGTVADVMPLVDENRVIASLGLPKLKQTKKVGLKALLDVCELGSPGEKLTVRHIGFQIGPRINAVGRIDDAAVALDLMLTQDPQEAAKIAGFMDRVNQERRAEQDRIVEDAMNRIEAEGCQDHYVIVVAGEGWHSGIVGIVASKIVDRYRRPTFVATVSDGKVKGSGRSIAGFNLAEALVANRHLILSGGGHEMAAGFSLLEENLDAFRLGLNQMAAATLTPESFAPVFDISAEVAAAEAAFQPAEELARLEPFGDGNPAPLLMTRGLTLVDVSPFRNPDHARLTFSDGRTNYSAVVFGRGREFAGIGKGVGLDLAFRPDFSEWNGRRQFRWQVEDYRRA